MKKVLLMIMLITALVVAMIVPASVVMADASATRSVTDEVVTAGQDIEVTIAVSGYGALGQVVETLDPIA